MHTYNCIYWWPGPDSRNDPLTIRSDTILWSWSADRIPQTPITTSSSDRENTKTVYWQLNHDIDHSLGRLELKLCDRGWMKNIRLMTSIHDVIMGGVATSFMCADTESVTASSMHAHSVVHDETWFGHAMFDRYVYVVNVIEIPTMLLTQDRTCSSKCFLVVCGFWLWRYCW